MLEATLKVKRGEAVFERDSVLFDEIQYSWPVTAALIRNGRLHLLFCAISHQIAARPVSFASGSVLPVLRGV